MERDSHQPFSIMRRKDSPYYFVQFWSKEQDKYLPARSTKETNENRARGVAQQWLKEFNGPPPKKAQKKHNAKDAIISYIKSFLLTEGVIKPSDILSLTALLTKLSESLHGIDNNKDNPLFVDYLRDFWDWNKSLYIKDKIESGQRIGKQYADANKGFVLRYAYPFFGQVRLGSITVYLLEEFKSSLPRQTTVGKKGLSPRSINAVIGCIGTALEEAHRLGLIVENPARRLRKLALGTKSRGILTIAEAQRVFNAQWKDSRCKLASLLAACHGFRAGEIGALCITDIEPAMNVITIRHSWERQEHKLKAPKNGRERIIYTNAWIIKELLDLYQLNPFSNGFIFWNTVKQDEPINLDSFRDSLQDVLIICGISLDEQKARRIDFHSWRHFANSSIRGELSDGILQQCMGHSSTEMTERYYHLTQEQGEIYRKAITQKILNVVMPTTTS